MIREKTEWTNIRWKNANDTEKPRVLLVGDSITDGYYENVANALETSINTDYIATSQAIDSPCFWRQIENLVLEFDYALIHFNNGLHGWHLNIEEYTNSYEKILDMIYRNAKLILAFSTPVMINGTKDIIDETKDNIIIQRNSAVKKLANRFNADINDLYTPMLNCPEFRLRDGYHFNDEGKRIQGVIVAERIKNILF